jgi:hypothetical protein
LVVLRGLSINNQGGTRTDGLDFVREGILHIENCVISGFAPGGIGINVTAPGTITHVLDTVMRDNHEGIVFQSNAVGNISRTRVERNVFLGISVRENAKVAVEDSVASENGFDIDIDALTAGRRHVAARNLAARFATAEEKNPPWRRVFPVDRTWRVRD